MTTTRDGEHLSANDSLADQADLARWHFMSEAKRHAVASVAYLALGSFSVLMFAASAGEPFTSEIWTVIRYAMLAGGLFTFFVSAPHAAFVAVMDSLDAKSIKKSVR